MYSCMTQEEMADLLKISKTKYLRKENGLTKMKREEVVKIAKILRLDENQLLTFWMADNLYEIMKKDKLLVQEALSVLDEHLNDYETTVIMPKRADNYNNERLTHQF